MASSINAIIERKIKIMKKRSDKLIEEAIKDIANKSEQMLKFGYDSVIDQYYSYITTSYYRHETGIGTGTGINLYRSNNIVSNGTKVYIKINADDMAGYKNGKNSVSASYVLDNLLEYGARGGLEETFIGIVLDNMGGIHSGTPSEIVDSMINKITNDYYIKWFKEKYDVSKIFK